MELRLWTLVFALLGAMACADSAMETEREDAVDASFATGKADGLNVEEGSPTARAVLDVVNHESYEVLDVDVGLSSRTVDHIVQARAHAPIATLAALDAVPWVGPYALSQLVAYVEANGLVTTTVTVPPGFGSITVQAPPDVVLPDAEFLEDGIWGFEHLEFPLDTGRVHVVQEVDPWHHNVVNGGELGDPLIVAAGDYELYLGASVMSVSVDDQQHVEITAGRVEVGPQGSCGADAGCSFTLRQRTGEAWNEEWDHVSALDGFGFGTGMYVLPGRYRVAFYTESSRSLDSPPSFAVNEGETVRPLVQGFAGLRVSAPATTLPSCDFTHARFTVSHERFVPHTPSEATLVEYRYSDAFVYVTWNEGTEQQKLSIGDTFWGAPGRYQIVVNGTATSVELTTNAVAEVHLGRLEVTDEQIHGGPGIFEVIETVDVYDTPNGMIDRATVLPRTAQCAHGTGYFVVPGDEYRLRFEYGTLYREEELTVPASAATTIRGVPNVGRLRIGTPSAGQFPLWNPVNPPTYTVGETTLTYGNDAVYLFDERYCERDEWTNQCNTRFHGPWGAAALGEEVRLPIGWYEIAINGAIEVIQVRSDETTHAVIGRLEVSDVFHGTYAVTRAGATAPLFDTPIPTGTGLFVPRGSYTVRVEHGEGYEQQFDVEVGTP